MLSAQTSGPVVVARAQDRASSRKTGLYFARLLPALFSELLRRNFEAFRV